MKSAITLFLSTAGTDAALDLLILSGLLLTIISPGVTVYSRLTFATTSYQFE
jgi:hypothetical protein